MDILQAIKEWRAELYAERDAILEYWSLKMVDTINGGFYGRRDGADRLHEKADKGVILNTRILWTFSHAVRKISPKYREYADRAYRYLIDHFMDHVDGGVYWMVDYKGRPINQRKQIYAQAFAVYAFSEYYLATRNAQSLDHAKGLFRLIEKHSFDEVFDGYIEAFDKRWGPLDDLRLSEKDANEKKTMNTHLHLLEAYTTLYRCWPDPALKQKLRNLVLIFRDRIISNKHHLCLFFDEQWDVKSNEVSYGHDIEGSWLLLEATDALADYDLMIEMKKICLAMVDAVIREGLENDGALRNEQHDPNKDWWPQAEALVGFTNAWQLTGNTLYLRFAMNSWRFIITNLADRRNGEWFWGVDAAGKILQHDDKAGPWKCPYHNTRAIIELLDRLPQ